MHIIFFSSHISIVCQSNLYLKGTFSTLLTVMRRYNFLYPPQCLSEQPLLEGTFSTRLTLFYHTMRQLSCAVFKLKFPEYRATYIYV